jgi:protein-S-isoprenylcysteine O-methyltransferase Ste14
MSRWTVTGLFVLIAVATAGNVVEVWRDVVVDPTARSGAVAAYSVLRLAIVLAFTFFVFTREPSRQVCRDPVAFAACGTAVACAVLLQRPPETVATAFVLAGDVVAFVACLWLLASVLTLGRCFGVLPEVRGLVTRGPYRFVRHPVYLGELAAAGGLVIAAPTRWNLVVAVVLVAAQMVRMRLEEKALAQEFSEYLAYAARTPRIIPRLVVRQQQELASGEHA